MQIININKDLFSIHLSTSKVDKMQRRLRIININDESIANKSVTIDGQQHSVTTDIEIIQEYDKIYELAIFEPKNTDDIIPNSPRSPRKIKSPRIQPKTSLSLNDEKIKLKSIWNKIPLYFMQIININKDLFSIHLSTSKV
eukprot:473376_1